MASGYLQVPPGPNARSARNPLVPAAASLLVSCLQQMIPAAEASLAPEIQFPGRQLKGRSVLDTLADRQPKRIPTIFAPFYSGFKFRLVERETPPGTTLHFSNMTLMLPNATYENLASSGMMEYFDFGQSARTCITNRYDIQFHADMAISCDV